MRYQPSPNDERAVVTMRTAGPDGKEAERVQHLLASCEAA